MDIDLRGLRYFVAVAEELHFSRAAARLHLDQPTLSRHIRRLEQRLGVELLERTTRSVTLTASGSAFLVKAREVIASADAAVEAARAGATGLVGELRIGMLVQIAPDLRARAFARFAGRYPQVALQPIGGFPYVEPTFGLASGETDVSFVWEPIRHPKIETRTLFEEPRYFVMSDSHPLAGKDVVTLDDVHDQPFFEFPTEYQADETAMTYGDYYQLQPRPNGTRRPIGAIVTNRDEWADALTRGLAISTAPATTATHHPWPGVIFVPAVGIGPAKVAIAWRRDRLTPIVENFVETVLEVARE